LEQAEQRSSSKRSSSRWTGRWVLFAVIVIYVAARLWNLAAVCLDGDEIFSVLLSRRGWLALTTAAAADSVHPPLFYYLLKVWVFIGNESLVWLRLLPALFSALAILPLILLGRELRLRPIEVHCAIGLAAVHPFLIYYAQHVRMYSLLLLCSLTSLWLFQRTLRAAARPSGFGYAALTLANVVLVYSHYYGCLIVGLECLYVLLWKRERWKRTLLSAVVVLASFAPWLYAAGTRAYAKGGLQSNLNWIAKPTLQDLVLFFVELTGIGDAPNVGQRVCGALVVLFLAALWVHWSRRHTRSLGHALSFLLYFTLCPVAISFVASCIMTSSIWGRRHLIFVAATLLLLISASCWRLRSRAMRLLAALACAAWAFAVISYHLGHDVKKAPYDTFVLRMLDREEEITAPIRLFALGKHLHYAPSFYLETLAAKKTAGFTVRFTPPELDRLSRKAAAFQIRRDATIDEARGAHFWVLTSTDSWRRKEMPRQILTQRGCRVGLDLTFCDRYRTMTALPVWCAP
jgi:hypothetical protein